MPTNIKNIAINLLNFRTDFELHNGFAQKCDFDDFQKNDAQLQNDAQNRKTAITRPRKCVWSWKPCLSFFFQAHLSCITEYHAAIKNSQNVQRLKQILKYRMTFCERLNARRWGNFNKKWQNSAQKSRPELKNNSPESFFNAHRFRIADFRKKKMRVWRFY